MIRFIVWAVATIMLGIAVHLTALLLAPRLTTQDALHRAMALGPDFVFHVLPRPSPDSQAIPLADPSFVMAICRYDLSKGPVRIRAPVAGGFFALSFYTPDALSFYSLNDKAAAKGVIELNLFTAAQLADIRSREGPDTPDSLRIEAPQKQGLVSIRALIPEDSQQDFIENALKAATCSPS